MHQYSSNKYKLSKMKQIKFKWNDIFVIHQRIWLRWNWKFAKYNNFQNLKWFYQFKIINKCQLLSNVHYNLRNRQRWPMCALVIMLPILLPYNACWSIIWSFHFMCEWSRHACSYSTRLFKSLLVFSIKISFNIVEFFYNENPS